MRIVFAAALLVCSVAFAQPILPSLAEPSLSPDGKEIAFVSGGDVWTVAAGGGEARLLVTDPATEWKPLWSPDGKRLAFVSNRTGNGDIYAVDLAGGAPVRITYDDGRDQLDAWSRDGRWLYFHSTCRDIAGMNDVWRVSSAGGTPMQVTAERYLNEYHSAPSPGGGSIAFAARGIASGQWWRHGSSHIDTSQLWTMEIATKRYEPLGEDGARSVWPMWMPDGRRLYFVSDRGGNENVWSIEVAPLSPSRGAIRVTNFTDGRVLWPTISHDGRTILFERDFGIWSLDTASGRVAAVDIRLRGVASGPAVERRRLTDRFNDFALSPDGKKVAFTARGDVFAASAKDGGDAARITNTSAAESEIAWSPDSRSIVYASDRDGRSHLYRYEFAAERETALTAGDSNEYAPRFSPDGKLLAFQRGRRELAVMDVASKQIRTLATALFDMAPFGSDRGFDWSPDSRWIAYVAVGEHGLRNVHVVSAAGGEPRQVSFLANAFTDFVTWSRDGRFILFNSAQRTEAGQIARVDLVPTTPKFREDQFRDLFREPEKKKEEKPPEPSRVGEEAEKKDEQKPVEIVFAGIRERVRLIPAGLDTSSVEISPDGKWIAFTANIGDHENVWVYSIDELATEPAVPKQISTSSGNKSNLRFTSDGKEIFYLDGGRIAAATIDPVKTRNVAVTAEMDVDFSREKSEAFAQGWRLLRDNFYDPAMHGADWNAIGDRFAPRVAAARNGDELRRLLSLMVGELNASHLGANAPGDATRTNTGRIGVVFDREEYENAGRLRVSEVIPLSPADVAKIRAGDVIVAVDGKPIRNFDVALEHTVNKRTVITIDGSPRRDIVLRPVRNNDEKGLIYRAWVNANREYVDKISGGRLGYVHMINMSAEALNQLYLDLDAENRSRQGVVVDLRNNNGGFVNVYAIDVLARRPYLSMTWRDHPTAGARTLLGQRALEKPTILLVNRHSLSDAEDFTEGYRTLGLGKVVGEPTAGWIIYTSNLPLIDGTIFRVPFIKITDSRGQNMERNPRPVDIPMLRKLGEKGDAELDVAVRELLSPH